MTEAQAGEIIRLLGGIRIGVFVLSLLAVGTATWVLCDLFDKLRG